jgi:hypothetical protein
MITSLRIIWGNEKLNMGISMQYSLSRQLVTRISTRLNMVQLYVTQRPTSRHFVSWNFIPFPFILLPFAHELKPSTHRKIALLRNTLRIHETPYTIQLLLSRYHVSPKPFRVDLYYQATGEVKDKGMQIITK